jgi:hypothetical protein
MTSTIRTLALGTKLHLAYAFDAAHVRDGGENALSTTGN